MREQFTSTSDGPQVGSGTDVSGSPEQVVEGSGSERGRRWIRIDPGSGSGGGSDLGPGRGSLLSAFSAWGQQAVRMIVAPEPEPTLAPDRRALAREDSLECLAWVGWKGHRQFFMNDAVVVNLSRGGAQIFLDAEPPKDNPVWIFLETPAENAIIKSRVLEVVATSHGQHSIRVAFDAPCSFALFEAAVCGMAPVNPKARLPFADQNAASAPHRRIAAG
jgi:PilZ domain